MTLEEIKRVARFLKGRPRLVQKFSIQKLLHKRRAFTDTDRATCVRTRKSTIGAALMLGPNNMKAISKAQTVIALSSGEAEYYGLGGV